MKSPVKRHATILTVSRDHAVLQSRNAVLESAGYRVVSTSDDSEALRMAQDGHIDAAVLGDSIPYEERRALVHGIKAISPTLPILMLRLTGDPPMPEVDSQMGSLDGPATLLARLRQLLERTLKQSA